MRKGKRYAAGTTFSFSCSGAAFIGRGRGGLLWPHSLHRDLNVFDARLFDVVVIHQVNDVVAGAGLMVRFGGYVARRFDLPAEGVAAGPLQRFDELRGILRRGPVGQW